VLVLTMHQSEELARDVLQAGARGYVLKSDADENLIAAVEKPAQHKPFLTPSRDRVSSSTATFATAPIRTRRAAP
jgi:DNA-binding NarL/FixJ family response regulator